MKLVFLLGLSFSMALCMEQSPQDYTLVSTDGQEVAIAAQLINILLPGLAEWFRSPAVKQGKGTIAVNVFSQDELRAVKVLLEKIYPLNQQYLKQIKAITTDAQKKIELAVFPEQEKLRELDERSKIYAAAQIQQERVVLDFVAKAKNELEQLPELGEYFLTLFDYLIRWKAVPILGKAAGIFAAEHIDFGDAGQYAELKKIYPQAQLIYLYEVSYSVETIYRAYEWFQELTNTPDIFTQEENHAYLDLISDKMNAFAIAHIEEILKKYPDFKTFIQDPGLKRVAFRLHQGLMQSTKIAFENVLMNYSKERGYPELINLGNSRLGIIYDQAMHVFNTSDHKLIKKIALNVLLPGIKKPDEFKFTGGWKADTIIAYHAYRIIVFDLSSNKIALNYTLQKRNSINAVHQLDENRLLVLTNVLTILDLKHLDQEPKVVPTSYGVKQVVVFDPENILIYVEFARRDMYITEIIFWNSLEEKTTRKTLLESRVSRTVKLNKINHQQCIGSLLYKDREKNLALYLLDAKAQTFAEIGEFKWELGSLYPLNANYFLGQGLYDVSYIPGQAYPQIQLWFLPTQVGVPFIDVATKDVAVLNYNHVAVALKNPDKVIIKFVPVTSTLSEILDEIQKRSASQPQESLKRSMPQVVAPEIPAAAQDLKPEARKVKQPRLEKPNG